MPCSKRDGVIRILASDYLHLLKSLFKVSIMELKTVEGLTVALIPLIQSVSSIGSPATFMSFLHSCEKTEGSS